LGGLFSGAGLGQSRSAEYWVALCRLPCDLLSRLGML